MNKILLWVILMLFEVLLKTLNTLQTLLMSLQPSTNVPLESLTFVAGIDISIDIPMASCKYPCTCVNCAMSVSTLLLSSSLIW